MSNNKQQTQTHKQQANSSIDNLNLKSISISGKNVPNADVHKNNNLIQNAQEAVKSSHLQSKLDDQQYKSSGKYFSHKNYENRSLKRTFGSSNNNQLAKLRQSGQKYKTLRTNDNIKRLQRLYTENSGNSQLQSRLLVGTKVQQTSLHKSLHESVPQGQKKSSQQYNKQHPPNLSKQQLYEENMKLKNTINELKDTLSRQKIQTELQKKKNKKYTLQLNREFKKEMYYNNIDRKAPDDVKEQERIANLYTNQESDPDNQQVQPRPSPFSEMMPKMSYYKIPASLSPPTIEPHSTVYMIAGIKQKYEQLRTQHQKVINQLRRYKATDAIKKLEEISVYCATLEDSNYKLATALEVAKRKLVAYEYPLGQPMEGKSKDMQMYAEAVILEISGKLETAKSKNAYLKQQNKRIKQQQKQQQKLTKYLQALLCSKSTLLYNQERAIKKTSSAIQQIEIEMFQQKKNSQTMKQSYLNQMQQISKRYENKLSEEKSLFEQELVEKNLEIKKLLKEIGYLNMIVENWRGAEVKEPQKEKEKQKVQQASIVPAVKNRKQSTVYGNFKIDLQKNGDSIKNQLFKYTQRRQMQKQYQQKVMQMASSSNRAAANNRGEDHTKTNAQKQKTKTQQRKRISSGVKHSQQSKKSRQVNIQQIIDLAQFIRYRLIGSRISFEDALLLLNFNPTEEEDVLIDQADAKWRKKYISQAELLKIFENAPFMVSKDMSLLFSRYIVEDEFVYENGDFVNSFVYIDPNNQIERIVAKSILKAFIQSISSSFINAPDIGSLNDTCEKQWAKIVQKSGSKINTPLISIAPSGFIGKDRWNQLLTSLNVEANEEVRQWCIGRMLVESESLSKLKYRVVVPDYI